MGRIVDLFGEVAAEADEGPEGLILPTDVWERLREDWEEEDIEDALTMVHESLLQGELVESADSLNCRLLDVLGEFGDAAAFRRAEAGQGTLSIEIIGQLARRVDRLEEILEVYRDGSPPERKRFDALRRRLMDLGIEKEMHGDDEDEDQDEP